MTSKILTLFFFILWIKASGQTLPSPVEIAELIKAKINDKKEPSLYTPVISKTIIGWPKILLVSSDDSQSNRLSIFRKRESVFLDTILSIEDKNYIALQVDSFTQKIWTINGIEYVTPADSLQSVTFLSFPLFSINREYAIIRQLSRRGKNWENTYVSLYRKINGKWTYYRYIFGGLF